MNKSEWPHSYHIYLSNQANILLSELNYSALQISQKYSQNGLRDDTAVGLSGVGIGLIIGISNLINDSVLFLRKNHDLKFPYQLGVKVCDASWCDLIVAAGNWVRHGDEWRSSTYDYLKSGDNFWRLLTLSKITNKEDFLQHFNSRHSKTNLDIILDAKIPLGSFILAANNYWTMAELLKLNDFDYSIKMFSEFLKAVADSIEEKQKR